MAAVIIGGAFHFGKILQEPARAESPKAETTTRNTPAESQAVKAESAELRAYLDGYAFNSMGENIGTIEHAITLYGCQGYYKPLCDTARDYGWRAQQ